MSRQTEKAGGSRLKAYVAVLAGAMALFIWGCGSTSNNDISSGGLPVSPSVSGSVIPLPSSTPLVQNTTVTFYTTDQRLFVTAGANATSVNVTFLSAGNASTANVVAFFGNLTYNHAQIGPLVFDGSVIDVTKITQVQFVFLDNTGRMIAGNTQSITMQPGSYNTDPVTATVGAATLARLTMAVNPANATLTAVNSTATFGVNGTFSFTQPTLTPSPYPYQAGIANVTSNVTASWTSSNTAVATINATSGVATALSSGTTTITASVINPANNATVNTTMNLTVNIANATTTITNVSVVPANLTIAVGNTSQVNVTATVNGTANRDVTANSTLTSSNATVANVAAGGVVTARAAGACNISALVNISNVAVNSTSNCSVTAR